MQQLCDDSAAFAWILTNSVGIMKNPEIYKKQVLAVIFKNHFSLQLSKTSTTTTMDPLTLLLEGRLPFQDGHKGKYIARPHLV